MQQTLITQQDSDLRQGAGKGYFTTFRQCLKASQGRMLYHRKLIFLMAAYWIFASFFIALPFYLFKKPIYCQTYNKDTPLLDQCCDQGDEGCVEEICTMFGSQILKHIKEQQTLTYLFRFFCNEDWKRVAYKIFPQTLPVIGFLVYGKLADMKGRQVAMKISWRLFTVGLIIFCSSQAKFLKTFGYVLASIHCLPSLISQFVLFFQHNAQKQRNRQILLLIACLFIGPLVLSFLSDVIISLDNRIVLSVLCAFPALVLAMTINKIHESAVCVYPYNKAWAFGLINKIAKENKKLPIMIDLSKSFWHREIVPKLNIFYLFNRKPINVKMVLGFFNMFVIMLNVKVSQVSLDFYTATHLRSLLVNVPTAIADLTLCIVLLSVKNRTCRFMYLGIILLIISLLACKQMDWSEDTIRVLAILHAVGIRYLSQLCYGLILIWSIETFPTICRGFCAGFVFSGTALGCLLAYLLRDYIQVAYIVCLVSTTFAVVLEGFIDLHKSGVMKDTLNYEYYDDNDCFYRT